MKKDGKEGREGDPSWGRLPPGVEEEWMPLQKAYKKQDNN